MAGDWVNRYFLAGMVSRNRAGKEGMGRVTALFLFCSAHDFMAPDMVGVIIFMSTGDGRKRRAVSDYGVETGHGAPRGMG